MRRSKKTAVAILMMLSIIMTGSFCLTAVPVNAEVGSVADDEDVTYDKDGNILSSIGIDTSKMPEDYDPDSTDNPYGSDVKSMNRVSELLMINTNETAYGDNAHLYGHDARLDGKISSLVPWAGISFGVTQKDTKADFLEAGCFAATADCDLKGTGRNQSLAIVYTNKNEENKTKLCLRIYDPYNGTKSEEFVLSDLTRINQPYLIQSQLQVSCGDYDNDTLDEIAVYVPSPDGKERAKVAVYDLIGDSGTDPYKKDSWMVRWNYTLKETSWIIHTQGSERMNNFYNNVDLTSGDADNDGIDDLIISYGSSSFGIENMAFSFTGHPVSSESVLLYGSDKGQMLKESQIISYGDEPLVRVSFAFGDLDDDGRDELILGGQQKNEQTENISRVLGKYVYDEDSHSMIPELIQNMYVVEGQKDEDGKFMSTNGWDGNYYSAPLMKTNLAVGKIFGPQSQTRIYLDSVLYSYDSTFAIEDELEDDSKEVDTSGAEKSKGSGAFTDIRLAGNEQWYYYEYGVQCANYNGGEYEYLALNRVADKLAVTSRMRASILYVSGRNTSQHLYRLIDNVLEFNFNETNAGSPFILASPDTDIDGTVLEYTGNHKITYTDPKVLAVLASAPYFKDVAAYDNGAMLKSCATTFGTSSGDTKGYQHTFSFEVGASLGSDFTKGIYFSVNSGFRMTGSWGHNTTKTFTVNYSTGGGEDAVVMYSVPSEDFEYIVTGVSVDSNGNPKVTRQKMYIHNPHKPVTQTLTLDDYNEIQAEYKDVLPDVKQYLGHTPGDPSSYPKSKNDIPKAAKEKLAKETELTSIKEGIKKDVIYEPKDNWEGISYGTGKTTQTYTVNNTESKQKDNILAGAWVNGDIGARIEIEKVAVWKIGAHVGGFGAEGGTYSTSDGLTFSCTVPNMPRSAKDYGYYFAWRMLWYSIEYDENCTFPVITYEVTDVQAPPELPQDIAQDFEKTTDSQTTLTWTYNTGTPQAFDIYKYYDFPQGGGNELVGTVNGSEYKLVKDENGNTVTDKNGHIVHQYSFTDTGLTADTKYQYRIKTRRSKVPQESIFSPVIEARTDVSRKPEVILTSNDLKIYPDGIYRVAAEVKNLEEYESHIDYQWQKYDQAKREWQDVTDCTTRTIAFYKSTREDAGTYRCRVNLVRKQEGHPQYISTYTESLKVSFSKRSVVFGDISVFEGRGKSDVNTGIAVSLSNTSTASMEKPTGKVTFKIEGPDAILLLSVPIDEATGEAKVQSIEDLLEDGEKELFCNGGYEVTASYGGSRIFYAADDPEEYHYLRNINETLWLSARSTYIFGEDILESAKLYDFKKGDYGQVIREDKTDLLTKIVIYEADEKGNKTGDAVAVYTLSETGGTAYLPLAPKLAEAGKAYIEAYTDSNEPVGFARIRIEKGAAKISLRNKMTGTGDLLELYDNDDIIFSGDGDLTTKNIVIEQSNKSLAELLKFVYFEANGDRIFDTGMTPEKIAAGKAELIPAEYKVGLEFPDEVYNYYDLTIEPAEYTVVGNFYKVSAKSADENEGIVAMVSPDVQEEYAEAGYAGGTKLIFKAVPNTGFRAKGWIIEEPGVESYTVSGSDTLNYTVKSADATGSGRIKITALFEPKNNVIAFGAKGNGSIEVSPLISSGSTIVAGTALTFKAIPDEGWHFKEWRWTEIGGSNWIATGTQAADGTNTKKVNMPDNPVSLYGVFMRDTVSIALSGDIEASYINNGGNPLEEIGAEVLTEGGRDVPKGSKVIVRTKEGYSLTDDAEWNVTITTPAGTRSIGAERVISGGRDGCSFNLPEDATACSVSTETGKGRFSLAVSADDVAFKVKVEGEERDGNNITGIESGSLVEITASPNRGKVISGWTVNGKKKDSTDTVYRTTIKGNLSVTAETAADEAVTLKLKTEGGGNAKYVITDKNGEAHEGTFDGTEITPTLYKGESLSISANGESYTTMTAVSVNGKRETVTDQTFAIEDIDSDTEIICRFTANTYYRATIHDNTKNQGTEILDKDKIKLSNGDAIETPRGGDLTIYVVMGSEYTPVVYHDETEWSPTEEKAYGNGRKIYKYDLTAVDKNQEVYISDSTPIEIGTPEELTRFLKDMVDNTKNTRTRDVVLTANIDMSDQSELVLETTVLGEPVTFGYCGGKYSGIFDGKGHKITGLRVSTSENPGTSLFEEITAEGCIRNVVFEDCVAYVTKYTPPYGAATTITQHAFLTNTNYGTISEVVMKDVHIISKGINDPSYCIAGIAVRNEGTISHCRLSGIKLDAVENVNGVLGCAGVIINQQEASGNAEMEGNYFEDIEVKGSEGLKPAAAEIIASASDTYKSNGRFKGNYYKTTLDADDKYGTKNIYKLTSHPNDETDAKAEAATPEFTRKLAHEMNIECGKAIWGITGNDETDFIQIALGGADYKAPVEAAFNTTDKSVKKYYYPGEYDLPGKDEFGENLIAWETGGKAYSPGYPAFVFDKDYEFTGRTGTDEITASLETDDGKKVFFKKLTDAFTAAAAHYDGSVQKLDIIGECEMEEGSFTIDDSTVMTLLSGSKLTMDEGTLITNKGSLVCEEGSQLHKYGAILNNGSITVGGTFVNYGSKLTGNGEISGRDKIQCNPHCWGKATVTEEPDADGKYYRVTKCDVCGAEQREEVDSPNPPGPVEPTEPGHITSIDIIETAFVLSTGESYQLHVSYTPQDSTDLLTWSSNNEGVASVDQSGRVTAVGLGNAIITVAAPSGVSDSCTVTVNDTSSQIITPTIITLPKASAITEGQTLASSTLSGGSANVEGAFAWAYSSIKPKLADSKKTEYEVVFIPSDTNNYSTATCKVKLEVKRKNDFAVTLSKKSFTYNGEVQKPTVKTVKYKGKTLKKSEYTVSFAKGCKSAGTYTVTLKGKGKYKGKWAQVSFTIKKAANPLTVKGKTASYKVKDLKSSKTLAASKAYTISNKAKSSLSYKITKVIPSGKDSYFTIDKKGNIAIKKGLAKGTYKVSVKVTAKATTNYKSTSKSATVAIKVTK